MSILILAAEFGLELAQYGIAGAAMLALIYFLLRLIKNSNEKDKWFIEQLGKKDEQIIKLQERTLLALENNSDALEALLKQLEKE